MNRIRQEFDSAILALSFLTRIPIQSPETPYSDEENASKRFTDSLKYFPWIGAIIGGFCALLITMTEPWLGRELAIAIALAGTAWLTGAIHEDGFADCCDGFGGGWDKEQILSIMKDSRVGTFAVLGLVFLIGIKFLALNKLDTLPMLAVLLLSHSLSRLLAVSYLLNYSYARSDDSSKIAAFAQPLTYREFFWAALPGIALLIGFGFATSLAVIFCLLLFRALFGRFMLHKLDGFSGDCLGAAQQLTELIILLILVVTHS